jgi:hypothetical protein
MFWSGLESALTAFNNQMALLPLGLSKILGITVHLGIPTEIPLYLMVFAAVLGLHRAVARGCAADADLSAIVTLLRPLHRECCAVAGSQPEIQQRRNTRRFGAATTSHSPSQARRRAHTNAATRPAVMTRLAAPGNIIAALGPKSSASIPISGAPAGVVPKNTAM